MLADSYVLLAVTDRLYIGIVDKLSIFKRAEATGDAELFEDCHTILILVRIIFYLSAPFHPFSVLAFLSFQGFAYPLAPSFRSTSSFYYHIVELSHYLSTYTSHINLLISTVVKSLNPHPLHPFAPSHLPPPHPILPKYLYYQIPTLHIPSHTPPKRRTAMVVANLNPDAISPLPGILNVSEYPNHSLTHSDKSSGPVFRGL